MAQISDEQIGKNLARMRGDMTQKVLADEMRARGWKWSQATVWSIEKGERPLRLAEAEDLKVIFQTGRNTLTSPDAIAELDYRQRVVGRKAHEFYQAIEEFEDAKVQMAASAEAADLVEGSIHDMGTRHWIETTPEGLLEQYRLAHDNPDLPPPTVEENAERRRNNGVYFNLMYDQFLERVTKSNG